MLADHTMCDKRSLEKRSASRQIGARPCATASPGRASLLRATATGVLLFLLSVCATEAFSQSFRLVTNGAPGETVSGGVPRLFSSPANNAYPSVLDRSAPSGTDYFSYVAKYASGEFFSFTVGTDGLGMNLQTGSFTNAQRAPFATSGHPGLDVAMLGNGCNQVTGSFVIHSVSLTAAQDVDAIDVSFTQLCEGQEPALVGRFTYNSAGTPLHALAPYEIEQPKSVPTLGSAGVTILVFALLVFGMASNRARKRTASRVHSHCTIYAKN